MHVRVELKGLNEMLDEAKQARVKHGHVSFQKIQLKIIVQDQEDLSERG